MGRVLLDGEHLLKGIRSFRTQTFRTQVCVSSYQANDRFLPDFYPSQLFETPPARMHLTDISCCIGQGSRVKRVLVANPSHP